VSEELRNVEQSVDVLMNNLGVHFAFLHDFCHGREAVLEALVRNQEGMVCYHVKNFGHYLRVLSHMILEMRPLDY